MPISGQFLTLNIAFCNRFRRCFVEKSGISVENAILSAILRRSIIHKISDRSGAEFAHFARLNVNLTCLSKILTHFLAKIFARPVRSSEGAYSNINIRGLFLFCPYDPGPCCRTGAFVIVSKNYGTFCTKCRAAFRWQRSETMVSL